MGFWLKEKKGQRLSRSTLKFQIQHFTNNVNVDDNQKVIKYAGFFFCTVRLSPELSSTDSENVSHVYIRQSNFYTNYTKIRVMFYYYYYALSLNLKWSKCLFSCLFLGQQFWTIKSFIAIFFLILHKPITNCTGCEIGVHKV